MTTTEKTREQRIDAHVLETGMDYQSAVALIDQVDRKAAERDAKFAEAHRVVAEAETRHAEERRAAVTTAARQAKEAAAAALAVPVEDDVDGDDEVAQLEERIAEGDTTVTEAALAKARSGAAGRVRFARLRRVAADRKAQRDAEAEAARLAVEFEQHARETLADRTPAALVESYDAAVAALRTYAEAVDARNRVVGALLRHPGARAYGAKLDDNTGVVYRPGSLPLDGHEYRREDVGQHMTRVIESAGLSRKHLTVIDRTHYRIDNRDPAVIAEGRQAVQP